MPRALPFALPCRLPASARTRSASFTALEVGNTLAKSRSNTTTFAPLASRGRYLPRTPEEKSYSGLISSLSLFFITYSFFAGRPPCIDDSYSSTTIGVCHYHETPGRRHPNEQESALVDGVIRVRDRHR